MRIAFNIDYHVKLYTGIGRYGRELLKAMIRLDVPCDVWLTRYMKDLLEPGDDMLSRGTFYPWPRRLTDRFWPSMEASRKGISWVHSSNGMMLPDGRGFRQTGMIHDLGPFNYGHMKTSEDTRSWRRRITDMINRAHCITVNSTATRNDLLELFPESSPRVFVTPLGIDHFSSSGKVHTGSDHILNVGTVEPRKNIGNLIRAYAELASRRDVPELVIAGRDGFRADEYRRLPEDLGIGHLVRFTGYISDEQLQDLFSRAACLVHPAHHEGFGFTVPEAFQWDLPVAAASTGGISEFFAECIWQVDPEDAGSIADGMEKAIFTGLTPEQRAARDQAEKNLTWENCARATLNALKQVDDS